jgi:hypothetical protein
MNHAESKTVALARSALASERADLDDAVSLISDDEGQTVIASSKIMELLLRVVAARRHLEKVERAPDPRHRSADALAGRSASQDR